MIWDILLGREEPAPNRKRRASDREPNPSPPSPPALTPTPEPSPPAPPVVTEPSPPAPPTEPTAQQ